MIKFNTGAQIKNLNIGQYVFESLRAGVRTIILRLPAVTPDHLLYLCARVSLPPKWGCDDGHCLTDIHTAVLATLHSACLSQ